MPSHQRHRKEEAWAMLGAIGTPEDFASLMGDVIAGGISYLLRDTYSTDLPAGSVNGTLADTGQVRTAVDANSKESIANGKLAFAAGAAAEMNPAVFYPAMTRVPGLILIGELLVDGASVSGISVGWFTAQSNSGGNTIRPVLGTALQVRSNGTAVSVGADLGLSVTTYKLIVVLRGTGAWHFIVGGVYTKVKLLWVGTAISTTPMYPGVGAVGVNTVGNADNARIPQGVTFIPDPLAYDSFTRANGALGSSEAVGPDAQVLVALAWQFTTGIWTVSSNTAICTPVPGADVIVNGAFAADTDWTKGSGWSIAAGVAAAVAASSDLTAAVAPLTVGLWYTVVYTLSAFAAGTNQAVVGGIAFPTHAANATYTETGRAGTTAFLMRGAGFTGSLDNVSAKAMTTAELFTSVQVSTADVIADISITLPAALGGVQAGLVLNLDSTSNPQNFILCYLDGRGNCVLEECVAGTTTIKFTTAITYAATGLLRAIRDGTSCRVFYNGAAVSTVQTMTANTNVRHGPFSTSALNSLDFFTLWPIGSENQFSALAAY